MGDSKQPPAKSGFLHMWTVYDHPKDAPDYYVARLWLVDGTGSHATNQAVASPNLESLRRLLASMGHIPLDRSPGDDPVIIETWI